MTARGRAADDPVVHVLREPLPWRGPELTECGLPLKALRTVERLALLAEHQTIGVRALDPICRNCCAIPRATNELTRLLEREIGRCSPGRARDDAARLEVELRAMCLLVANHSDEFWQLVSLLGDPEVAAFREAVTTFRDYRHKLRQQSGACSEPRQTT